jgi:hypothetical protein
MNGSVDGTIRQCAQVPTSTTASPIGLAAVTGMYAMVQRVKSKGKIKGLHKSFKLKISSLNFKN